MIYYFTGTGNSRYIARELHQQLSEDYISVNYPVVLTVYTSDL